MSTQPSGTPDAGAAPAAPATTPAAEPGASVQEILNYDPFEPPKETAQEPAADPAQPAPQTPDPAAPAPGTEGQQPQTVTLEQFQALEAKLAAIEASRQAAAQQGYQQPSQGYQPQQPQGQGQGQGQQPQGQQTQRRYGYTVPQPIFDALNSDDPRARSEGLVTLMNGISEIIHDTVVRDIETRLEALRTEVPQQIQHTTQQIEEAKTIFNDFYGAWPELNNPNFHQLVGQIAARVGQQPGKKWSPATRDEIGREVYKILKWPIPGQRQAAPKPPVQSSPSARPGAPAPLDDQQKEIADLF